jgi:hypothetical protein
MEYVTLSANGIRGNIYGNTSGYNNSKLRTNDLNNVHNITGQFGQQTEFGGYIYPSCGTNAYRDSMAQVSQQDRQAQAMQNGYEGYSKRRMSGF